LKLFQIKALENGIDLAVRVRHAGGVDCEIPLADLRIKIPSASKFKLNFS